MCDNQCLYIFQAVGSDGMMDVPQYRVFDAMELHDALSEYLREGESVGDGTFIVVEDNCGQKRGKVFNVTAKFVITPTNQRPDEG